MKRLFELFLASVLFLSLLPLFALIIIVIKLDSKGPGIFKQNRVGRFNQDFTLFKFRTMFIYANPQAHSPAQLTDARITRCGKFLRKYAIDEWPQLVNIIKGEMSFIGPRPQLRIELEKFNKEYHCLLAKRWTVRPGLTCLWAISAGGEKTKPTPEMLKEDCRYIDQKSLKHDLQILKNTFQYLVKGTNRL